MGFGEEAVVGDVASEKLSLVYRNAVIFVFGLVLDSLSGSVSAQKADSEKACYQRAELGHENDREVDHDVHCGLFRY